MSGKILNLVQPEWTDIPKALRSIAEEIETGKHGSVHSVVLVMESTLSDPVDVFGLGEGTRMATATHFLLCLGQRKIEQHIVEEIS